MPDHDQAERLAELVETALELPPQERASFAREACAGDDVMRDRVEALLRREAEVGEFLETPAFHVGAVALASTLEDLDLGVGDGWKQGARVDEYVIGPLLGEGGMGEVYLAEDSKLGRQVAIKVVRYGFRTGRLLRHFRHEERILAALNHPNIARLYGGATAPDGTPYFVMEYIEGERLDVYCRSRALPVEERLTLFRKVCAAVSYAHQNLVIHRDLKPANIRVTPEGEPKLLDFGIAKLLDVEPESTDDPPTMTLPGVMTPEYASPEQARGEIITTASDVYSLGVVFYELLTGQRPYRIKSRRPDEMARAIRESIPDRPSTVTRREETDTRQGFPGALTPRMRRRLAGDLDNIAAMALRKEPARRYASVAQFSEDIRRHQEGLPVIARRDTFRYRAGKFIGRNKAGVAAGVFVFLALLAGMLATAWQAQVARRQRDRAERRFADVRRLANALLFDIAPKMERLEGSVDARQALVQRAQEYLDSLANESAGDPALQTELATAYLKVGELRGDPLRPNLGDFAGAVASYEKAGHILRQLLALHPDDPALLSSYGAALKDLSRVREWSGNVQGALDDAEAARVVYDRLFPVTPGSARDRANAAETLIQVARRHYLNDELSEVYPPLHAAIDALETLRRTDPEATEILALLGRAHTLLGITLSWDNRQAEGEAEMAQAFVLMEGLVAAYPQDGVLRKGLLNTYIQGEQLYEEADDARAYEISLKARDLAERALHEDPADAQAQQNLAKVLIRLGTIALRLHHAESAVGFLTRAEAIFVKLESDPRSARANQIDLGLAEATLGEARAEQGKFAEALASFDRAVGLYETMTRDDPANKMPLRKLAIVYTYIGDARRSLACTFTGDARDAEMRAAGENFARALEQYAQLEARQSMTAYDRTKKEQIQQAQAELGAR